MKKFLFESTILILAVFMTLGCDRLQLPNEKPPGTGDLEFGEVRAPGPETNPGPVQGPKGNGEAYGVVNITTLEDEPAEFTPVPENLTLPKNPVFEIITPPRNGTVATAFPDVESPTLEEVRATFIPNPGFLGIDTFRYRIKGKTNSLVVDAFVDVAPCLRSRKEREAGENIHVIGIYAVDAYEPNFAPVSVLVRPGSGPVTLYLNSYETVTWKITLEPGAEVESVVLNASAGSRVEGVPADKVRNIDIPTSLYRWEPTDRESTRESAYFDAIEKIRNDADKTETTFQGCYFGQKFEVPYTPQSLLESCRNIIPSRYDYRTQNCTLKCAERVFGPTNYVQLVPPNWSSATWGSVTIHEGNLSASGPAGLVAGGAKSNLGKSCGKHYFEMTVVRMGGTWWAHTADFSYLEAVPVSTSSYHGIDFSNFQPGDVLRIAVDLDSGLISYARNDTWVVQDQDMGLFLWQPVFFHVGLSEHTTIDVNFGQNAFQYQMPEGFAPWRSETVGFAPVLNPIAFPGSHKVLQGAVLSEKLYYLPTKPENTSFELLEGPTHGQLTVDESTGEFVFVAASDFFGPEKFKFRVKQGEKLSNIETVLLETIPTTPAPPTTTAKVHCVSVYSASGPVLEYPASGISGSVNIQVKDTSGPVVLVLNGYEGGEWNITATAGVHIQSVILSGYYYQRAGTLPSGVPLYLSSYEYRESSNFPYFYKLNTQGISNIETLIGKSCNTHRDLYYANQVAIESD